MRQSKGDTKRKGRETDRQVILIEGRQKNVLEPVTEPREKPAREMRERERKRQRKSQRREKIRTNQSLSGTFQEDTADRPFLPLRSFHLQVDCKFH